MKGAGFFIKRSNKTYCYILIILIIVFYIIENFVLGTIVSNTLLQKGIPLILWLGLIVFVLNLPKPKINGSLKTRNDIKWWAFSAALVFVLITFVAGFFDGLGKSPYNHSILGIASNIITIGGTIIGREVVRSYLINNFKMRKNHLPLFFIGIGMGILSVSFQQLYDLHGFKDIFEYSSKYILPEISQNIFATYLAFLGGAIPSTIYWGVMEGFHWLSPVLPDLEWIMEALIGILVPLFSYLILENMYEKNSNKIRNDRKEEGVLGWVLTCIISISMVWFVVGVFPIYPSVIATGSMEPLIYPGDVIVIDKIQDEEEIGHLQVGDIIQFERDDILISHRIIDYKKENGIISFCTKGDNNISADQEIVKAEMIKGKVIKVIPKVGWPTLLVKSSNNNVPEKINNGTKVVDLERKE